MIWICGFGFEDFNHWVSKSMLVCLGLELRISISRFGLRIWMFGFGPQDLDLWVLVSEIGSLGLIVLDRVSRFGSRDFVSQELDL